MAGPAPAAEPGSPTGNRSGGRLLKALRFLVSLAALLVLLLLLRIFFFAPYQISSGSMEPALHGDRPGERLEGDTVLVLKSAYWLGAPARWDIVAFHSVESGAAAAENLVKRVAGLPGETVEIRSHRLLIDGAPAQLPDGMPPDNYIGRGPFGTRELRLGPDEYFLLGDNSYLSEDSRQWGPVPGKNIFGRVVWILHPWARLGRVE